MVISDLKQLGAGISNIETIFIQDKWAEWIENLSFVNPSNIKKEVIATHICHNIDWKIKNVNRSEIYHTNSILVQKYDLTENMSKISIDVDYNFERKSHGSYKGSIHKIA